MNKEEIVLKITEDKLKDKRVMKPFLKNKLNLPDYFKFGFEIEGSIDEEKIKNDMIRYNNSNFFDNENFKGIGEIIVYEENRYGGLDDCIGGEIITPILNDCEESWLDLKKACEYLKENAICTERCSVHTNIGAQALGSEYKNWYNFCKIIAACEPEIYKYLANGNKIRSCAISGGFREKFAMPIAEKIRTGLEKSDNDNDNVNDINTLLNNCSFNGSYQTKKDKSISLKGIYRNEESELISKEELDKSAYGRRIEFRMANGTFSPEEIQNHLYIIYKIIELSRNLSIEKDKKLEALLEKPLPQNYNEKPDINRVIDVANILFDNKEDKLQFLFTVCNREKCKKEEINDKQELLKLIKEENMVLEYASTELKSDKEVVLEAVKRGGAQLQYASEELRGNKEIALIAVQKYGKAIQYVSEELRGDKEVVLEAIKKGGYALEYVSEELKEDKEIILTAIKNRKGALKYASEKILLDKEFFAEVYKDNEIVHKYLLFNRVDDEENFVKQMEKDEIIYKYFLKEAIDGNEEIKKYVLKAFYNLNCDNWNFKYNEEIEKEKYEKIAIETLDKVRKGNDNKLLLEIISIEPRLFQYLSEEEKKEKEIVLKVLERKPSFFKYVCPELQGDKEIVLLVIKDDENALQYASKGLRGDKEVVLEAVKNSERALAYASEELRGDKEVVLEAVKNSERALGYASEELRGDKEVVLEAIKKSGYALQYASEALKGNKEVILEAVKKNSYALGYASEELRGDKEVVLEAIKKDRYVLRFVSEELQGDKEIVSIIEAEKQKKIEER